MEEEPTFIDLFCGVGGMTLGFMRAGLEAVAAFDNWESAVRGYRRNFVDHIHQVSITEDLELPAATLIVGGPPCQGFSSAGTRCADDHRNTLVAVFVPTIAQPKPPGFPFRELER